MYSCQQPRLDEEFESLECDPVFVYISSSTKPEIIERRIYRGMTVRQLKNRLELLTGNEQSSMHLELYDSQDTLLANLEEDAATLDAYDVTTGCRLHILDDYQYHLKPEPNFSLTWEEYDRKPGTLRSFLRGNNMGKYNADVQRRRRERRQQRLLEAAARVPHFQEGTRCVVDVPGRPLRAATVMYNGDVLGLRGTLIGVQYDGPLGKNDGSFAGRRYFTCPHKFGAFVEPCCVQLEKHEVAFENDDEI